MTAVLFVLATSPVLAATVSVDSVSPGDLVITEFMANPDCVSDSYGEWFEIENLTRDDVDLDGMEVYDEGTNTFTVSGTVVVKAGGRVIFGVDGDTSLNGGVTVDYDYTSSFQIANSDDEVIIANASGEIDGVRYTSSWGIDSGESKVLERSTGIWCDSVSTFGCGDLGTPGAANDACTVVTTTTTTTTTTSTSTTGTTATGTTGTGTTGTGTTGTGTTGTGTGGTCTTLLVVNELLPAVAGDDLGYEWVELHNPSDAAVDLGGWWLDYAKSSWSAGTPLEGSVPARGFLVVGGPSVSFADFVDDALDLGNAGSSADGVRVRCPEGGVADTVVYGASNSDGLLDDGGGAATSLAPVPKDDWCLARRADGLDTDASGKDFLLVEPDQCTPGAANPADTCDVSGGATVKVNEVMFDPEGADGGLEWVELVNTGSSTVALGGWVLEAAKSSWSAQAVLAEGTTLPAGGFLLIGAGGEPGDLDLGNASTNGDGVRLLDCLGDGVDTVLYGPDNSDGLTGDGGSTEVAEAPGEGESLARVDDGVDTDAPADWDACEAPTPGGANVACFGGTTGGDNGTTGGDNGTTGGDTGAGPGGPQGCGEPDADGGPGCGVAGRSPLGGLALLLVATGLVRRRSR